MKGKQQPGGQYRKGTVILSGRAVEYTVRVSSRAKNILLRVGTESGLEVVVPRKHDPGSLDSILLKKQKWILEKLNFFERLAGGAEYLTRGGGEGVLFCGAEYGIETRVRPGSAPEVAVGENRLVLTVSDQSGEYVAGVLESWYRHMARLIFSQRARSISQGLNLSYNRIFIRGQKTRWGSCSRKKNLNFNWRLVMAPRQVQDYVIVHELMHLIEPNHSKKFWSLVNEACPQYREHRAWLRENGHRLRIPFHGDNGQKN